MNNHVQSGKWPFQEKKRHIRIIKSTSYIIKPNFMLKPSPRPWYPTHFTPQCEKSVQQNISMHDEWFHPPENQLFHTKLDCKTNLAIMYAVFTSILRVIWRWGRVLSMTVMGLFSEGIVLESSVNPFNSQFNKLQLLYEMSHEII